MRSLVSLIVVVWLLIGLFASWQRGYFGDDQEVTCKTAGDTVLTIVVGPLNYVGVNPKVDCDVELPTPSE